MAASSISRKAVLVLALVMFSTAAAQADVRVHATKDLSQDKQVEAISRVAIALVAAGTVYQRCDKELGITDAQKQELTDRFNRATDAYLKAFHDAYVKRVDYPPDAQTVSDYTAHIQKQYQQAAVDTAATIDGKGGCHNTGVRNITRYLDKIEEEEAKEKAAAAAEE